MSLAATFFRGALSLATNILYSIQYKNAIEIVYKCILFLLYFFEYKYFDEVYINVHE